MPFTSMAAWSGLSHTCGSIVCVWSAPCVVWSQCPSSKCFLSNFLVSSITFRLPFPDPSFIACAFVSSSSSPMTKNTSARVTSFTSSAVGWKSCGPVVVITFFTVASSPATFAAKQYSGANDTTTFGPGLSGHCASVLVDLVPPPQPELSSGIAAARTTMPTAMSQNRLPFIIALLEPEGITS